MTIFYWEQNEPLSNLQFIIGLMLYNILGLLTDNYSWYDETLALSSDTYSWYDNIFLNKIIYYFLYFFIYKLALFNLVDILYYDNTLALLVDVLHDMMIG